MKNDNVSDNSTMAAASVKTEDVIENEADAYFQEFLNKKSNKTAGKNVSANATANSTMNTSVNASVPTPTHVHLNKTTNVTFVEKSTKNHNEKKKLQSYKKSKNKNMFMQGNNQKNVGTRNENLDK